MAGSVSTSCPLYASPIRRSTVPASESGTEIFVAGDRTATPFTLYLLKLVPQALAAWARGPSADAYWWLAGVHSMRKPRPTRQRVAAPTPQAVGEDLARARRAPRYC